MIKLTKNETAVFNAIQVATTAEDVAVIVEMKKAAVLGVLVSLMKKGVATSEEQEGGKMYSQTPDVEVELFQEVKEEDEQEEPKQAQEEAPQATVEVVQEQEEPKQEQASEKPADAELKKGGKPRKVANASRIREQIAMVKASMSKEEAIAHVIMFGVTVLGQSKALAKAYVTENYDKVKV